MEQSKYLRQEFNIVCGVKALEPGHPVYLLMMEDDSGIVIKREDTVVNQSDVKHNLSVMKSVSPAAKGKLLSATEIQNLTDYATRNQNYQQSIQQPEGAEMMGFRTDLATVAGQGSAWFKMASVPGLLSLKGALAALAANDKQGIKSIGKALNASGGFEMLGCILAADLFNANTDRFRLNSAAGSRDGGQNSRTGGRFRVLVNLGNVLISVHKNDRVFVGLDSYDPTSDYNDMSASIQTLDTGRMSYDKWSGHLLATTGRTRRLAYCKDIYDDLEDALGPRNRRYAFLNQHRLDPKGPARINAGIEKGARKIREKVGQLAGKTGAPAGLRERLNIISA